MDLRDGNIEVAVQTPNFYNISINSSEIYFKIIKKRWS